MMVGRMQQKGAAMTHMEVQGRLVLDKDLDGHARREGGDAVASQGEPCQADATALEDACAPAIHTLHAVKQYLSPAGIVISSQTSFFDI